jgi:hypothetical protein
MDTMIAPVVRLSIGIARLFQDVFVGERKWFRRTPSATGRDRPRIKRSRGRGSWYADPQAKGYNLQAAILAALRKRDGGAVVGEGSPTARRLNSR